MSRLTALRDAGVSIWLDTLSRDLLESGAFASLVADGVTGATSNPTIFERAISASDRYDADLGRMAAAGVRDARAAFLALAVADVRAAARVLHPVYERSGGRDGFVSLQCTPDLADDTDATIGQALELWERVAAPNAMIKVPATPAGLPAIEWLTAAGVNVNVTLLFSVARYRQVIDAHLRGLERRAAAGRPLAGIASAASFFLSRIDARADARLHPASPLRGRVAVANARVAYRTWRQAFAGARWEALARAGAAAQRPLWASLGPKDPAYRDVLYVEELIGPGVIDTLPEATLRAFAAHGRVARTVDGEPAPERTLAKAAAAGVDLDGIMAELEREGVEAFRASYREVLARVRVGLDAAAQRAAA